MKRVRRLNPRYNEYLDYLDQHINGVRRSWLEILQPAIESSDINISQDKLDSITMQINNHDESKYSNEEFYAYLNHFYPSSGFEDNKRDYDLAWLHHLHNNPHHSQYWLLVRDEGQIEALDIPIEYVCEMICDWHSFSLKDKNSTAYQWWIDNKDNFNLSDDTVEWVEKLIEFMKEPLQTK